MADDPELQAIRQRRMQEIMAQQGGGAGGMPQNMEQAQQQAEQRQAAEEQRQEMLVRILTPDARERLNRVRLVKPEKAMGIENMLLAAAQRGAIGEKVTEDRLITLLTQVNEQTQKKTSVKIIRRTSALDDDDW
ncbi:programmed cell death protein 5-like protein [Chloropicon primus]|uniref:Programmed cell death protein 5-like protein n=1 Tax=Chloropicon primus TaxID=1764295 RepID=A0A5B8MV70_9CHLO|nr:programmed cell death protein 5-like protein [Chloropicon primus]UPR03668.1 programmed cell death protein 5-like protein [Chloropicon primus]|eukprot:QDZ24459.1 programmed cell death protein 5-like protein [Chloropicon primus]